MVMHTANLKGLVNYGCPTSVSDVPIVSLFRPMCLLLSVGLVYWWCPTVVTGVAYASGPTFETTELSLPLVEVAIPTSEPFFSCCLATETDTVYWLSHSWGLCSEHVFYTFMEPRNRFQGMNSASLCSLAGRYDNPIPTRFLVPIECLKIPALVVPCLSRWTDCITGRDWYSVPTYGTYMHSHS